MIIAVDMVESKLATARELGATHIVDASSHDPVKAIREHDRRRRRLLVRGDRPEDDGRAGFDCIRPGGTATIIGMIPVGQKVELDGPMFLREKKIQGSSMGSNRFRVDMPRYIDFYLQGRLKLDEMITRARPARGRERRVPRDEGRRGGAHRADVRLAATASG